MAQKLTLPINGTPSKHDNYALLSPDSVKKKKLAEAVASCIRKADHGISHIVSVANPLTLSGIFAGLALSGSPAHTITEVANFCTAFTGPVAFLALGTLEIWNAIHGWVDFFKKISEKNLSWDALGAALSPTFAAAGCAFLSAVGLNAMAGGALIAAGTATILGALAPGAFALAFAIAAIKSFKSAFDTYYTLHDLFKRHGFTYNEKQYHLSGWDKFNLYGKDIITGCAATLGVLAAGGGLLIPAICGVALAAACPPLFIALMVLGAIAGLVFLGLTLYSKFHKQSGAEKAAKTIFTEKKKGNNPVTFFAKKSKTETNNENNSINPATTSESTPLLPH
jgi:hypothetical protein